MCSLHLFPVVLLVSHYILSHDNYVSASNAKIGLVETSLAIIPGGGKALELFSSRSMFCF